jgi:hypothetical protein
MNTVAGLFAGALSPSSEGAFAGLAKRYSICDP